jgi:hypothetical protein
MTEIDAVKSQLRKSCPLVNENIAQITFLSRLMLIMPYCDHEEHAPSEFYCPGKQITQVLFQGKNNAEAKQ